MEVPKPKKQKIKHENVAVEKEVEAVDDTAVKQEENEAEWEEEEEEEVSGDDTNKETCDEKQCTAALTNEDGDSYFEISDKKRVTVKTYKGKAMVDVREVRVKRK